MNRIQTFLANKSHVSLPFLKYGLAGGLATETHVAAFALLNETVLPADKSQLGSSRGWNFLVANMIAFVLANVVAYLTNRAWVFQSGRHALWREVLLFFLVSGIAFVAGTPLGSLIVSHFAINEYFVFVLVLAFSIMVNFLGRKYWVFLHSYGRRISGEGIEQQSASAIKRLIPKTPADHTQPESRCAPWSDATATPSST